VPSIVALAVKSDIFIDAIIYSCIIIVGSDANVDSNLIP